MSPYLRAIRREPGHRSTHLQHIDRNIRSDSSVQCCFHVLERVEAISRQLKAKHPVRGHVRMTNDRLVLSNHIFWTRSGKEYHIEDATNGSIGEHRLILTELVEFVILSVGVKNQHAESVAVRFDAHVERVGAVEVLVHTSGPLISSEQRIAKGSIENMSKGCVDIFAET